MFGSKVLSLLLTLVWLIKVNKSQCSSNTPIDYVFLIDSSATIGSANFDIAKSWVQTLVSSEISSDARVSYITFDETPTIQLSMTSSPTNANTLPYNGGGSRDTGTAVELANGEFPSNIRQKLLIIITDGQPSNELCQKSDIIKQNDVMTFIIGVSEKFISSEVDCLTSDPSTYVLELDNYASSHINDYIIPSISDMICPTEYQVKLTEVQLSSSGSRFVEFYNYGKDVSLADISVSGAFSGEIPSTATWSQGSYLVLYDDNLSTKPSCINCGCSSTQCSGATYIACSSSNSCSYSSGGISSWEQRIENDATATTLHTVTYDSSTWVSLTSSYAGFTWELKYSGYDSTKGFNWVQSCDTLGTPGDSRYDCSWTCDAADCTLNGASDATCGSNSLCTCNEASYAATDYTCRSLPEPSNCIVYVYKEYYQTDTYQETPNAFIVWDRAPVDEDHQYQVTFFDLTGSTAAQQTRDRSKQTTNFYFSGIDSLTYGATIATYYQTGSNSFATSDTIECSIITLDPTPAPSHNPSGIPTPAPSNVPTAKPTFAPPKIWITGDICAQDRCSCNGASYGCVGNDIKRQYLAKEETQFITLRMYPIDYPNFVYVNWTLISYGETDNNGSQETNINSTVYEGIRPESGIVVFNGEFDQRIALNISLVTKIAGTNYRTYKLVLTGCHTIDGKDCFPVYPSNLTMIVDISGGSIVTSNSTEKEIPVWLWWVIGALLLFLFILAWLVYKYWFAKKQTEQQLHDTEEELDQALEENELGFGNELGDGNINFNKLATGAPKSYKAPDYVDPNKPHKDDDIGNQTAKVDIERFDHRQEFGPTMGTAPPKRN